MLEWFTEYPGDMPPGVRWLLLAGCVVTGALLVLHHRQNHS